MKLISLVILACLTLSSHTCFAGQSKKRHAEPTRPAATTPVSQNFNTQYFAPAVMPGLSSAAASSSSGGDAFGLGLAGPAFPGGEGFIARSFLWGLYSYSEPLPDVEMRKNILLALHLGQNDVAAEMLMDLEGYKSAKDRLRYSTGELKYGP